MLVSAKHQHGLATGMWLPPSRASFPPPSPSILDLAALGFMG